MGSIEDATERRNVKSDLIRSGWPDSSTYTQGFSYAGKIKAVQVHEAFLESLVDMCITGWLDKAEVEMLGACAKTNMPRALDLLGMASEGGETGGVKLPNFWSWPVLAKEPERKDVKGNTLYEVA